ncbi:MAG TPA: hypothetical protein VFV87_15415 [Pirellulaceae bacterium]|nr:hypothetical protein [Pirellulaceae bacterium]
MYSPNEFWLNLHRLTEAYDAEGMTTAERFANITRQFQAMPPLAQQEILQELRRLTIHLPELYPVVAAEAADEPPQQPSLARREDVA